jgi:O-succinylbenzoate synthase
MKVPFRGLTEREGLLIKGPQGWGEFSPFLEYPAATCRRWLAAAREAAFEPWPAPLRSRIPVNVTVPAVAPEVAHDMVIASKCPVAKVKVGSGDDAGRVEAVRQALGPSGRVRVDANGRWTVDEAARKLRELNRFDLEYAEQPVRTVEEMAALRKRVNVPLAADEAIRTDHDSARVKVLRAADIVVLKVQPLGGVRACMRIAERTGLPAVVSSALETSVGIAAGLALAAALPELPHACGLGTVGLLAGDVTSDPLLPVAGHIELRRPEPDPPAKWAATERTGWWVDRAGVAGGLG